ncbi:hypothetical protein CGMCC3_g4682 [Colletotrichum fructicola]|nr:uncharacterized protein CGMCC3_g4682 [Colletotrichum fructicola]KAE9579075.1 hypothetical protein CGMCC3_g4682 [Colletotrichum fructicola]
MGKVHHVQEHLLCLDSARTVGDTGGVWGLSVLCDWLLPPPAVFPLLLGSGLGAPACITVGGGTLTAKKYSHARPLQIDISYLPHLISGQAWDV